MQVLAKKNQVKILAEIQKIVEFFWFWGFWGEKFELEKCLKKNPNPKLFFLKNFLKTQ